MCDWPFWIDRSSPADVCGAVPVWRRRRCATFCCLTWGCPGKAGRPCRDREEHDRRGRLFPLAPAPLRLGIGGRCRRPDLLLQHGSPEITRQWRPELRYRLGGERRSGSGEIGIAVPHVGERIGGFGVGVVEFRPAGETERPDAERVPERREDERRRRALSRSPAFGATAASPAAAVPPIRSSDGGGSLRGGPMSLIGHPFG